MAPTLIKSENDKRDYRSFVLDNKLRVTVVHDPTTDKAAAAMDVHVGHFSDPEELPGLAHFCEHMLFLGTEKYPEESSYREYLSQHSGTANAYTSMEHTCYFFDVSHVHFEGALDRFSQFFISPLFTESATDREMQAVNNENGKNLQADNWRLFQLMKSLANPAHPFHKFGTGNNSTLKKDGIDTRAALLEFHDKYYSSNIMTLTLIGRESLDDLQKWVEDKFTAIKNKDVAVPEWTVPVFGPNELKRNVKFVPVRNQRTVQVSWPLPALTPKYITKPARYLSHLLGHEGPGSLLSLLKAKGWAEELSSGAMRRGTNFTFFECRINLTEGGLAHTDEIVTDIYRYIDMLKRADYSGIQEWVWKETHTVAASNFRFKDTENPRSYVVDIASNMQKYPAEYYLTGGRLYFEYNRDDVIAVIDQLNVDNSLVVVGAPEFADTLDLKERWYGTEHSITPYSAEQIAAWTHPTADDKLCLPAPNTFIANDFTMTDLPDNSAKHPMLIRDTAKTRLWFKQDNVFRKPKGLVKMRLDTPVVYASPLNTCKSVIFSQLVDDALNEYSYLAEIASLQYTMAHNRTGVRFEVRGYNQQLHVLALKALSQLVNFQIKPERFDLIKAELIREYENNKLNQPYQHAVYDQRCAIESVRWTIPEYLEVMKDITMEEVQAFIPQIMAAYRAEVLIHGNFTKEGALAFMDQIEETLGGRPLRPYERPIQRIIKLEAGKEYVRAKRVLNPDNKNSAIQVYYQVGPETTEEVVLMDLLRQIAKTSAFEQLRTKEQLGYLVWVQAASNNSIQSLNVILQSSDHPATYLDERINAWTELFKTELEEMSDEDFGKYVQAVIDAKLEKDKTMLQESRRWWNEVVENLYVFDRVDREVAALRALGKSDLLSFYAKYILGEGRRRLAIMYFGKDHEMPTEFGDKIMVDDNLHAFKQSLDLYPASVPHPDLAPMSDL